MLDNSNLLIRAKPYKTYSMYYCHGKGFEVLRDNATSTRREEGWLPLSFDHDTTDYSSYLTNARYEPALHCHRTDQKWMKMLLPDVYHDRWEVPAPYGGLKGELAIFLALVAFAIPVDSLQTYLPAMFQSGQWQQFDMSNGSMLSRLCSIGEEKHLVTDFAHRRRPQTRCCRRSLDILTSRGGYFARTPRGTGGEWLLLPLDPAWHVCDATLPWWCPVVSAKPAAYVSRIAYNSPAGRLIRLSYLIHLAPISPNGTCTFLGRFFPASSCMFPPTPASRHCNPRQSGMMHDENMTFSYKTTRSLSSLRFICPFPSSPPLSSLFHGAQHLSHQSNQYQNVPPRSPHPHTAHCTRNIYLASWLYLQPTK